MRFEARRTENARKCLQVKPTEGEIRQAAGQNRFGPCCTVPASSYYHINRGRDVRQTVSSLNLAILLENQPSKLGNSMKNHGPWRISDTREVYQDPWIRLRVDQVLRPDGNPGTYCTVHLKPGVCVIAMDQQQNVYLTKEFHYAVGRVTIEGVSGGIEPTEDALSTAQRELVEELGITAQTFRSLGMVDPFTAAILSPTELFLAEDLTFGPTSHEGTEVIEKVKVPLAEALEWVDRGVITHAPSCVALLKIDRYHRS